MAMMRLAPVFCVNIVGRVVRANAIPATVQRSSRGLCTPRYEVALEFARVLTLPEEEEFQREPIDPQKGAAHRAAVYG
jgi:hypothetical protein